MRLVDEDVIDAKLVSRRETLVGQTIGVAAAFCERDCNDPVASARWKLTIIRSPDGLSIPPISRTQPRSLAMIDRKELSRLRRAEFDAAHGSPAWERAYEEKMDYLLATMPNAVCAVVGRHGNVIVRAVPDTAPILVPEAAVLRLDTADRSPDCKIPSIWFEEE
jgi:hypothetical protein